MSFGDGWNRRTFLGSLAALASTMFGRGRLLASTTSADAGSKTKTSVKGFGASGNVYEELGVPTVINGEGTMTVLGGSLMRPEVEAVMAMAGRHFVSIADLEVAAGKRIAEMLKLPEGYAVIVTSGAAAAMQSGHTDRQQSQIHRTIAGSDGHEVGSAHPKVASQPIRPPVAIDGREIDRGGIGGRREEERRAANGDDAFFEFRQR